MALTASQVRLLAAKGLSAMDIAELMEAGERDASQVVTRRTSSADRTREWRKREAAKRDASRDVTEAAEKEKKDQKEKEDSPPKKTPKGVQKGLPLGKPRQPRKRSGARTRKPAPPKPEYNEAIYQRFWKVFPKRAGPDAVRKKLRIIIESGKATIEDVVAGAERYAASVVGQEERYVQAPTPWLNAGRWADEYRKAAPTPVEGPPKPGLQPNGRWWFPVEDPRFQAWDQHRRRTEGRGYPTDRFNGWWFDSEKPPPFLRLMQA